MSALLEDLQTVIQVSKNRTLVVIHYLAEFDPNFTTTLDKDDTLELAQHTERLGVVGSKVTKEIGDAALKNWEFVITEATLELLATIVDVIKAEDKLIRKMTFMPVEARHGFIQIGNNVVELISQIVKEHG